MCRISCYLMAVVGCSEAIFGAVGAVAVQTTPTQAILAFTVTDPTQCTVKIFSDAANTLPADDSNATLFPGSQQCNRSGSAIDGVNVSFVAGLRTSQKASDGKLHSRALAALSTYYYTITDLVDSQTAQGSFVTRNPAQGNLYPEQPLFDPNAWDNRAYPQLDWSAGRRNQMVVDPVTGYLVKRVTFASDGFAKGLNSTDGVGSQLAAGVTANGTCASANNLNTSGTSLASCTGAATIFMPLPAFQMIGSGTFNNWYPRFNVDDLILYIYGSADSTASGAGDGSDTLMVCLAKGANVPCLSSQFPVTLQGSPKATGTVKVPASTPAPVFANWGYTPLHGDVVPTPGTVSVSGNTVSLTNPGQGGTYANAFDVTWPAGSQIYIQGSSAWGCLNDYCTIGSIQSAVQLTTVETCSSGCPASANYEGRAFGFQIVRKGASGSIKVSFGFEADMSTSWSVIEDGLTQHCNSNPVTVSNDAAGNPYPGYTLSGYICTFQHEWAGIAYWLFISKDQNGAPLGEARPLGQLGLPSNWSSNGATVPTNANFGFAGWDAADGTRFLSAASYNSNQRGPTALLIAGQYDSTKPGCTPPYQNWKGYLNYIGAYATPPDSCFTYTNLTNPSASPPMDLRSQIVRAYAAYNPGFDLSGFTNVGLPVVAGGYARACVAATTSGGDRELQVCGTFDSSTGNLVQVFDSFSKYPGRWGYVHGPPHVLGRIHSLTLDQPYPGSASTGSALYGPFGMAVTAVNRAGFGQTPNWTTVGSGPGTSIAANEGYACPTGIPQYLLDAGAAGNYCIQMKVSSEPCSHTPGTAAIYPGNTTEAQQFPCTSTDGSVVTNAAWSKLQNIAEGDWVRQNEDGNDYSENFIVAKKDVISPTEIQLWFIRGNGVWPNQAQRPYANFGATHPDGMSLAMTATYGLSAAVWLMDASDPTATWVADNPAWALVHGSSNVGSTPDRKTAIAVDLQDQSKFAGFYDQPVSLQVMQPLPDLSAAFPVWAGSTAGYNGFVQQYMNNDQVAAQTRRWVVNYRHLNPSYGAGFEYRTAAGGNDRLALVAGTAQVYKMTDPNSGGPPDPKQLPFIMFAGRYLLRDISSPVTSQNTITDSTNFAACYALHAGECRMDSQAGDHYVSVPGATGENQCLTNQYEETAPCFFNATPIAGKIQQMDISGPYDGAGARQRMLPTGFTGIGGQYQFSEPKMSPDGAWMFVPCWWLNGVRSDVCGVALTPLQQLTSSKTPVGTGFLPYDVKVDGTPGDQVRVCWGYAENGAVDGSPNSLYPAPRRERGCSTNSAPVGDGAGLGNTATFVNTDTTTQGSWKAMYGSDGYNLAGDSVQYPWYANVNVIGANTYVWAAQTSDVRAMQSVQNPWSVAATYYNATFFTVDLNLTDGAQHTVAFYILDWDPLNRSESVQVLDAVSGAVLDTQTAANFQNGVYLVWQLSGHVIVKFTNTGPNNAVLSGILLGSGPFGSGPPPAPAVTGPFGWASEPAAYADCSSGCTLRMNLIPDRVAYYIIETNRGGQVIQSAVKTAVPYPAGSTP